MKLQSCGKVLYVLRQKVKKKVVKQFYQPLNYPFEVKVPIKGVVPNYQRLLRTVRSWKFTQTTHPGPPSILQQEMLKRQMTNVDMHKWSSTAYKFKICNHPVTDTYTPTHPTPKLLRTVNDSLHKALLVGQSALPATALIQP